MKSTSDTPIFFANNIQNQLIILDTDESAHAAKVLRLRNGDNVRIIDGQGTLFLAKLMDVNPKSCTAEILETHPNFEKRNFYLHMAIAPTKNIDRLEWFVEKAVEMGIDEITPILCKHSERQVLKTERLERIVLSAVKQSQKAFLPKINALTPISDILKQDFSGKKCIAYCGNVPKTPLKSAVQEKENTLILIGPEGDFSADEVQQALDNHFIAVTLGNSRLRTETAGIAAVHTVQLINE